MIYKVKFTQGFTQNFKLIIILLLLICNKGYSQFFYSKELNHKDSLNRLDANKLKQGLWLLSDTDNKPVILCPFVNDTIDGKYIQFWENGQAHIIKEYKKGKLWNTIALFDTNGKFIDPGNVHNGNGFEKTYYITDSSNVFYKGKININGNQLFYTTEFRNGSPYGKQVFYSRKGLAIEIHTIRPPLKLYDAIYDSESNEPVSYFISGPIDTIPTYFLTKDFIVEAIQDEKCQAQYSPRSLKSFDLFIPEEYQTPERLRKLKKLKKYFKKNRDWDIHY
ncbi:MAG: hypothetical protein V2A54_12800 [Bacteroidota bacterium]